ncbi:uncharacterized protein LOC122312778 [Carya illinoinensis]|uniref:uncharacterized protein LOC122312778 n=1 Tax=Carya illinoinensis TaxID=32201 RepID=UPI001C727EB2|nr:uncharacterized protein LOC122312778 [Carya illinoinensis]
MAVLDSLNSGTIPSQLNRTLICLISKKKICEFVSDYRPISLCNVVYKLASKVIVNRLKGFLPAIISESQCAFVGGRLVSDNVLIAYELVNYLRNKRHGKKGYMSIKLDMSKAYDRVEWGFLEKIMLKLGFAPRFVNLIMECIKTVTFLVLINGHAHGNISPTRGIRQGDPLSPYLFLFCTEGLIALLKAAEAQRNLKGVKICRGAPMVTHLLFADDSILFCRADVETTAFIQGLLTKYEMASGQKVNKEKTSIVFSKNVDANKQRELLQLWGNNPSYAWKGIFEARKWLMKGCRWRVGNGEMVKIWKDAWLPGPRTLQPELDINTNSEFDEAATVDSLIDMATRTWKEHHIRALFNPRTAEEILKIRLSSTPCIDSNGETSMQVQDSHLWKKIWHMKVPRKIKMFAWRGCKDILPTLVNLRRKKVVEESLCCFCLDNEEDLNHALLICPTNQIVWQKYFPLFKVFNSSFTFLQTVRRIQLQAYKDVRDATSRQQLQQLTKWQAPLEGFLKVNVDGAIFADQRKAGIGVVLRDTNGAILMAASKIEMEVDEAATIEAIAILRGIQLSLPLGIPKLIIETDCLHVVQELQSSEASYASVGNLFADINHLMMRFQEAQVIHVNRMGNGVAHSLARHAWNIEDINVWWDQIPSFVHHSLWFDNI